MNGWLVGGTYQAAYPVIGAERCINLLPERVETKNPKSDLVLRRTPGLRLFGTLTDQPGRHLFAQDGRLFAMAGAKYFEVAANGTPTVLGSVAPSGHPGSTVSNGGRGNQLLIESGGLGYTYGLTSGTFAQITDAQFPTNVIKVAFSDGYGIAITADRFGLSSLFDFSAYAAEEGQRAGASDNIIGGLVDHEVVWLFGSQRTEVWYNSGATFPFQPIPGVFIQEGLAAREACASFDNSVAWLGQGESGARVVWQAREYSPQRISTHAIEAMLSRCPSVADFRMFTWSMDGHAVLTLTSAQNKLTLCYDAATQLWFELSYRNPATGMDEAHRAASHAYCFGKNLVLDRESGKIWQLDFSTYADGDDAIRWVRQSPYITKEHTTIFHHRLELGGRFGAGLVSGQGVAPVVGMQYSDDGGETWSAELFRSLGAMGKFLTRVAWDGLGSSRQRIYRLFGSDPVETVLIDGYLHASVGVH